MRASFLSSTTSCCFPSTASSASGPRKKAINAEIAPRFAEDVKTRWAHTPGHGNAEERSEGTRKNGRGGDVCEAAAAAVGVMYAGEPTPVAKDLQQSSLRSLSTVGSADQDRRTAVFRRGR